MTIAWTKPLPSLLYCNLRLLLLTLLLGISIPEFAGATTWYTLADGSYSDGSDVWSLDGSNACSCAPPANIAGPFDTVYVRHKITMTSNVRMGGRSEFFIDQGARFSGNFDFLIANSSLTNRGTIAVDDVNMRLGSHFYAINQGDLTGTLTCDEARVELSGSLNIIGDVLNRNGGFIQIFSNATMYVDGTYNNDGVTDIQPGSCVNLVADFTNPITGNVTGGGYIRSFSNITNVGFWDPNVSWCADGTGTGLPTAPNCVNCGALPVELAAFDAVYQRESGMVDLSWTTVYEVNNDFFTIERSIDGLNYTVLNQVNADEGAASGAQYTIADPVPLADQLFYRLRQTDNDGTQKVLGVVQVNALGNDRVNAEVFPNPFTDRLQFSVGGGEAQSLELTVTDLRGRTVFQFATDQELTYHHGDLDLGNLPAGTYLVQIRSGNFRDVRKVVKR
jgi:hypothetical protein